ncbi:hypothetical protein D3C86_1112500 [compost metagenome]
MRQRKARRARDEAKLLLLGNGVDLVDHAVDVVRQLVAARPNIAIEGQQALRTLHHLALGADRQAQPGKAVEHHAVGGGTVRALQLANPVGEEGQRPLGGDARVQLPQAAGGGVARIDEGLLAGLGLAFIELVELGAVHEDLAAHFQHGRRLAAQLQRNRLDGPHVGGHVLAGLAVAARGGLHEPAVLVAQRHRQAVELQFAGVFHGLIGRLGGAEQVVAVSWRGRGGPAQPLGAAAVEIDDIFVGEAIVQRQHRHAMPHGIERGQRRAAHALGGRIVGQQVGMLGLQRLEFAEQRVVLGVRNRRIIEHVVLVGVAFEFIAQPLHARGSGGIGRQRTGGRGGRSLRALSLGGHGRLPYRLNRRWAADEPAGMPRASSFSYSFSSWAKIATNDASVSGRMLSSTSWAPMRWARL